MAAMCEKQGITTVAVTQLPSHYQLALPHVHRMRHVKLALGLHPLAIASGMRELPLFLKLLPEVQFIGEIGLDFSSEGRKTKADQLTVFESIIDALNGRQRFVSIHSRGAVDTLLDVLERRDCRDVVLHWFTGSLGSLDRAVEHGCWFSVNPAMTSSSSGRAVIAKMPRERVLTETDAPYVQVGGRAAIPSDVKAVLTFLATVWGMSVAETEAEVFSNYECASGTGNASSVRRSK
jgi:TatD DNase family protein